MIKFFRHIRKDLMETGKTGKYFKYAIGEIILVVIGILIALQISNWNDERKNTKFESEIIGLIDNNLLQDSILIVKELNKSRLANASSIRLIDQVSKGVYSDSLNYMMGDIINFQRFKSQSSAFEVLKSKGIENIRNNELQLALIEYYDQTLFRTYESLLDIEKSFNADWVPLLKQEFSNFKWTEYAEPIDSKAFFEKPSTIVLFKLFKDNRAGQISSMEQALKSIAEIRSLIKSGK